MLVLILRSAHGQVLEQAGRSRARVSKDEDAPSCFETHRSAPRR